MDDETIEMDDETIRELAWNLCKKYDLTGKRRSRIWLLNFVSGEMERMHGEVIENLYRSSWNNEATLFCAKYKYTD